MVGCGWRVVGGAGGLPQGGCDGSSSVGGGGGGHTLASSYAVVGVDHTEGYGMGMKTAGGLAGVRRGLAKGADVGGFLSKPAGISYSATSSMREIEERVVS